MSGEKKAIWFEQEFTGSTSNVIKSVLLGKADAGAAFTSELQKEPAEIREQFRSILATPKIPPHPLGAHPRVPLPAQEAIRKAVLALPAAGGGAALLATVRLALPVAADYGRDYRELEGIDVRGLSNWGK